MPMVDYLCDACSYRFENFFHSDPPELQPCPHIECQGGTAKRIQSMPGEYRPVNARRFDPIVLWVSDSNPDQISVPGRADEPVQAGYHRVEITNLSEADRYSKYMNQIAARDATNNYAAQQTYWDERTKARREEIRAKIGTNNHRAMAMFKAVCEHTDRKRAQKEAGYNRNPNGHFQVISFDSSNRHGQVDVETGWRERRK